jgi:hypothetical protein
MLFSPQFEPKGADKDCSPPDSLRLVFSWFIFGVIQRCPAGKSAGALVLHPIPGNRDPENLQCRAVFTQYQRAVVPASDGASGSNPFLTHGTVESPVKWFATGHYSKHENRRPQSTHRALCPTPSLVGGGSQNLVRVHLFESKRELPLPIRQAGSRSNTVLWWTAALINHFCWLANSGNIRRGS